MYPHIFVHFTTYGTGPFLYPTSILLIKRQAHLYSDFTLIGLNTRTYINKLCVWKL